MSKNSKLNKAKEVKDDEFYTLYENFEKNIELYKDKLKDKIIYCNCDNYEVSNIFKYFVNNFEELQLKKLVSTCINNNLKVEFDGKDYNIKEMESIGSFDSKECIETLQEIDIVITNPPFSKFKDFINLLVESGKDFIVYGSNTAMTVKNFFSYLVDKKIFINSICKSEKFIKKGKETSITIYIYSTFKINNKQKLKLNQKEPEILKCDKTGYFFINSIKELQSNMNQVAVPIGLFNYDYSDYDLIRMVRPWTDKKEYFRRFLIKKKII
jgi:hypothetical protein